MAFAYKLVVALFSLLKSFSFFCYFPLATYAKFSYQDSNYIYAGTIDDTRDDTMIYACYGGYAERVSLKCTSSVARQYSNG